MNVTVTFMGPLGEYTGQRTVRFEFPDGATYGTLLKEIGRRFGGRFPDRLWDARAEAFGAGILCIGNGRDLESPEMPLVDGEEIRIVPLFGGG